MRLDLAFQMFLGVVISVSIKIITEKKIIKDKGETIQISLFSIAPSISAIFNGSL